MSIGDRQALEAIKRDAYTLDAAHVVETIYMQQTAAMYVLCAIYYKPTEIRRVAAMLSTDRSKVDGLSMVPEANRILLPREWYTERYGHWMGNELVDLKLTGRNACLQALVDYFCYHGPAKSDGELLGPFNSLEYPINHVLYQLVPWDNARWGMPTRDAYGIVPGQPLSTEQAAALGRRQGVVSLRGHISLDELHRR